MISYTPSTHPLWLWRSTWKAAADHFFRLFSKPTWRLPMHAHAPASWYCGDWWTIIIWPWIIEISGGLPLKSLRTIIFQQVQPVKNGNSLQLSDTVTPENSKNKNGANIVGEIPLSGMYQDRINGETKTRWWFQIYTYIYIQYIYTHIFLPLLGEMIQCD